MAATFTVSTVAFADEASARPPRGSSQDRACVQATEDERAARLDMRTAYANWFTNRTPQNSWRLYTAELRLDLATEGKKKACKS
jgi:hypothetical protein